MQILQRNRQQMVRTNALPVINVNQFHLTGKRKATKHPATDAPSGVPKRLRLFLRNPASPSDPSRSSSPASDHSCSPSPSVSRASTPTLVATRPTSPCTPSIPTPVLEKADLSRLAADGHSSTRLPKSTLTTELDLNTKDASGSPDNESLANTGGCGDIPSSMQSSTGDARGAVQKLTRRMAILPSQQEPGVLRSNSSIANIIRNLCSFFDSSPGLHENATRIRDFIFGDLHLDRLEGTEFWSKTSDLASLANFIQRRKHYDAASTFAKYYAYLCFAIKCHQYVPIHATISNLTKKTIG